MATAEEREMLRIQKMMEGGPRKAGIISPRSQPAAPAPSPQPKQVSIEYLSLIAALILCPKL
jgi:hypothetical protein